MKRNTKKEGPYTTGDIARHFGVAERTAWLWTKRGLMESYFLPGSRHRRVTRAAVMKFLEDHPKIPRPDFFVEDAGTI